MKRTSVLDNVVKKRIPRNADTRWNFKTRCVNTVFKYKKEIAECLGIIEDDDSNDYSTTRKAVGLRKLLNNDHEFLFWLEFFSKILPHCDILFNQLQRRDVDSVKAVKNVSDLKSAIQLTRNSLDLDHHWDNGNGNEEIAGPKRIRFVDSRKIVAKEVCDLVMANIDERFAFSDHLSAAILFQPSLFPKHKLLFPDKEFQTTVKLFDLDENELRQELIVIYSRNDFQTANGALTLLKCIYENNLETVLPESVKLLRIICTIPMTTAESERCFSTLKRIKTFTRNTMKEERLSALAMCSIEKALLNVPNFNELVIDHFAEGKERRMDFIYKRIN